MIIFIYLGYISKYPHAFRTLRLESSPISVQYIGMKWKFAATQDPGNSAIHAGMLHHGFAIDSRSKKELTETKKFSYNMPNN